MTNFKASEINPFSTASNSFVANESPFNVAEEISNFKQSIPGRMSYSNFSLVKKPHYRCTIKNMTPLEPLKSK